MLRDGKPEKIRLVGIDCPETGQAFGTKAKQFTADVCTGKEATIEWSKREAYGRILGTVMVGQVNVNHELVKAGLAWQFTRYDKTKELAELEAAARKAKIGLWSEPAPVAPWDWRQAEAVRKKANPKRPNKVSPARRS